MTATPQSTIREIVATDYRTAAVFARYGLDFCCHGCRTIEQGCRDARADVTAVHSSASAEKRSVARRDQGAVECAELVVFVSLTHERTVYFTS